jgi:cyclic pyranopterin phosphate synthase
MKNDATRPNAVLTDRFGRLHNYLRISVTDRCNLRCRYCMPPHGIALVARDELLTFDEIICLASIFVDLGVRKIRVTGGEPLVRKGIEDLCARLATIAGLQTLALSTNGVLLEEKVDALRRAGVRQLNVSLDSLKPDRFEAMARRQQFAEVLRGIEAAVDAGFDAVKINTVVMRGFNDDELLDFVEFAQALSLHLRFIEYMPFVDNAWTAEKLMPYREMMKAITARYELTPLTSEAEVKGPAKEFRVGNSSATVGFITTMSDPFCGDCSRLRLAADGTMRNCLFSTEPFDLKRLLRAGASRDVIEDTIRAAVILKWKQHPGAEALSSNPHQAMTAIGG